MHVPPQKGQRWVFERPTSQGEIIQRARGAVAFRDVAEDFAKNFCNLKRPVHFLRTEGNKVSSLDGALFIL